MIEIFACYQMWSSVSLSLFLGVMFELVFQANLQKNSSPALGSIFWVFLAIFLISQVGLIVLMVYQFTSVKKSNSDRVSYLRSQSYSLVTN